MNLLLILGGLISLYYGVFQLFRNYFLIDGPYDSTVGFSLSISIAIIALYNCFTYFENKVYRAICIGLIAIFITMLIFSGSRVGLISIFISSVLFFYKKYFSILVGIGLLGVLFSFNYKIDSTQGRIFIYQTAISMLDSPSHLLWGRGAGGFRKEYMIYQAESLKNKTTDVCQRADNIRHPLNEFLLLLINHGIIVLLLLLIMVLVVIRNVVHFDLFQIAIFITIFVFSLFAYPFRYPITWIVLIWNFSNLRFYQRKKIYLIPKSFFVVLLLFISISLSLYVTQTIYLHYDWAKAYNVSRLGRFETASVLYEKVYDGLNNMPEFLYNYASFLLKVGDIERALFVIQQCDIIDYETQILKAEIFLANLNYQEALSHYKLAADMCPNRFVPLFAMYRIYGLLLDKTSQCKIANEILTKPVKVPSYQINNIVRTVKQENILAK